MQFTFGFISCLISVSIGFFFGFKTNDNDIKQIDTLYIDRYIVQDNTLQFIENDTLLYQHYLAVLYQDSAVNSKTVKDFCLKAKMINPKETFGVANKETALKLGTAKSCNNLVGFKKARKRFTWALYPAKNNNAYYRNAFFSLIDYDYFRRNGSKRWSALNLKGW